MALSEKDSELSIQAATFAKVLASDPQKYQQSETTAAVVTEKAAAYVASYEALVLARTGGVRSEQMTARMYADRQAMLDVVRPIYLAVQASKQIGDEDKIALGVHVKRARRAKSSVPDESPLVTVAKVDGSVVSVRMRDRAFPIRRARPALADGISVFIFVGDEPPADLSAFTFAGNTGRTSMEVRFPPSVPMGATVWFSAVYFNTRKQPGPASAPVHATIGAGSTMPMTKMAA